jgi:hypothetical protein
MPRFLLLLLLFCSPLTAAAQDGDRQLCDGKYLLAQEMLDAAYGKYGTIYSGGFDGSLYGSNGVGPTIDLWRLWRGLPDLRFRDADRFDWYGNEWGVGDLVGFGQRSENFAMLLRIAERKQETGLQDNYRYITALYLNMLVSAGSGPGWWLAPGHRDATDGQKLVMEVTKPGSLMEWLLVMQADSDTPDSVAWVRSPEWAPPGVWRQKDGWATSYQYPWTTKTPKALLRTVVGERSRSEPGLEWKVAAIVTDGDRDGDRNIPSAKPDCAATPAEHALWAVEVYEYLKREGVGAHLGVLNYLPRKMRQHAMANLAMLAVRQISFSREPVSAQATLRRVAAFSPSPRFSSWLFVGRAWTAGTVADLVSHHDGSRLDGYAADTLNMLSVDDLAAFADQATLPDDQHLALITVTAGRAFVLGRLDIARRYLVELQGLMPDHATRIEDALDGPGGDEVQIARAILTLPAPTVWLRDYHQGEFGRGRKTTCCFHDMDLPLRFTSAAILNRDLRQWMAAPPDPWRWSVTRRASERGRVYDDRYERPFIPDDWHKDEGFPFLRLIAWNELSQLDVCHGLTNRLSEVLIDWVDQNSDTWLERVFVDDSLFPETLHRIILLNKHSPGPLVNGQPAGQVAKRLLETRFPDTEAAQATRYWYYEGRGCRA